MPTILLQIRDLRTYFDTARGIVRAVDGVSFDVREGETVTIVGESGCGKSVSALSVLRLVPHPGRIAGGEVIFEGRDLLKATEDEMKRIRGRKIAMVFQEPMTSLNPVLSIGEQIAEPVRVHLKMDVKSARRRAIELLQSVGISDAEKRYDDYPHRFSGGMRQRVMIAMALSCNPKVLIADEPTTALDVTIQAQLLDLMTGLARQMGTSVILITHNLGIVARYADRVNVMYAGRIVETATGDGLYQAPKHPYTLGLLQCLPRTDKDVTQKLLPIKGMPPDLSQQIAGCYFQPRCPFYISRCLEEYPPMGPAGAEHQYACFNPRNI